MSIKRWVVAVIAAVAIAILAVAGVAAWKIYAAPTDAPTSTLHARPECGHQWADSVKVDQVKDIIDVPEFHDCQRFLVPDGTGYKYDKLFAIFVSQTIRSLDARLGPVQQLVVVPTGTSTVVPIQPGTPTATSVTSLRAGMVAVVYAEGSYATLGIETGLNCLYVWRFVTPAQPPQLEAWSARMVPKGAAKSCPDGTVGDIGPGKDLKVSRAPVPGFPNVDDYPPVTRWDWDGTHGKQYVGVACGAAWCEIYDDQLASSPPLPVNPGDPPNVRRVRLIKGWYDQQFVARYDASGNPVPTTIMGTIVPDPTLGAMSDDDFDNKWVHVADIGFVLASGDESEALETYKEKFNFVLAPITDPVTLYIKGKLGQEMWKARIKRPGLLGWLTLKHKNAMRRPATSNPVEYPVPGVARFRWMTVDEGTWIRCSAGCCEMSDY
jgi:hypothetical protein